jgi:hypothetical protein
VRRLDELEDANRWAHRLADFGDRTATVAAALHEFVSDPPPLTPTFVARLLAQLRAAAGAHPPLLRLEHWIAEQGMQAEEASARANERVALTQLIMANSITSLRGIARMDWEAFRASDEAVLPGSGGMYAGMTLGAGPVPPRGGAHLEALASPSRTSRGSRWTWHSPRPATGRGLPAPARRPHLRDEGLAEVGGPSARRHRLIAGRPSPETS